MTGSHDLPVEEIQPEHPVQPVPAETTPLLRALQLAHPPLSDFLSYAINAGSDDGRDPESGDFKKMHTDLQNLLDHQSKAKNTFLSVTYPISLTLGVFIMLQAAGMAAAAPAVFGIKSETVDDIFWIGSMVGNVPLVTNVFNSLFELGYDKFVSVLRNPREFLSTIKAGLASLIPQPNFSDLTWKVLNTICFSAIAYAIPASSATPVQAAEEVISNPIYRLICQLDSVFTTTVVNGSYSTIWFYLLKRLRHFSIKPDERDFLRRFVALSSTKISDFAKKDPKQFLQWMAEYQELDQSNARLMKKGEKNEVQALEEKLALLQQLFIKKDAAEIQAEISRVEAQVATPSESLNMDRDESLISERMDEASSTSGSETLEALAAEIDIAKLKGRLAKLIKQLDINQGQKSKLLKKLDSVTQLNRSQLAMCVICLALAVWYVMPSAATAKNGAPIVKNILSFLPEQLQDVFANPVSLFMASFLANLPIFAKGGIDLAKQVGNLVDALLNTALTMKLDPLQKYLAGFEKSDWLLAAISTPLNIVFTASQVGLASKNPFLLEPLEMVFSILIMAYAFSNMNIRGFVNNLVSQLTKYWYGEKVEHFACPEEGDAATQKREAKIIAEQVMARELKHYMLTKIESLNMNELREVAPESVTSKMPETQPPQVAPSRSWGSLFKKVGDGINWCITLSHEPTNPEAGPAYTSLP